MAGAVLGFIAPEHVDQLFPAYRTRVEREHRQDSELPATPGQRLVITRARNKRQATECDQP